MRERGTHEIELLLSEPEIRAWLEPEQDEHDGDDECAERRDRR
jgi:hypothetical protein